MISRIVEILSYGYMLRALIIGTLVSLCAALLGVSLVLKRYSMIGDGLSHVGFGAMSVAMVLGLAPLPVALPIVIAAAFLLLRLSDRSIIKGDAAIAVVASGSLAIGLIAVSLSSGMNADVNSYMFGSILAMSSSDLILSILLSSAVLILYVLCYNRIFSVTFDESFATATGVKSGFYSSMLSICAAVTVVIGMRMMGALLISSLIIFPPLTAMRLAKNFRKVVILSVVTSVICFILGLFASFFFSTPVGASVVAVNLLALIISVGVGKLREAAA